MNLVTLDDLKAALPSKKNVVTEEMVDIINGTLTEPEFQGESLLDTARMYEHLLGNSRYSVTDYLNAIKFCAYLVTVKDNYTEAYAKTFGHRDFVKERVNQPTNSSKYVELTSAASRYKRTNKLVAQILTISQMPMEMMFLGSRYKAVGVLAEVMESAYLDRDKINAAKELLAATKGAENMNIAMEIGPSAAAQDMQASIEEQVAKMAMNQMKLIEAGFDIAEVQKTGVNLNVIGTTEDE